MLPDSPTPTPHDEDAPSRIFDETRPSTLNRTIPTTEAELPPALRDEASEAQPLIEPDNVPEVVIEPDALVAPELLEEFAATQQPAATEAPAATPNQPPAAIELANSTEQPVAPAPIAPTPPAENPALALTFAPAPDAPFQSSVTVGIRCDAPDARIHYTLDGSLPDQTSTLYTPEKILLTQSATLSARAFAGEKSGPTNSADYIVKKPLWQENEPADPTDKTEHKWSENASAPDGWQTGAASVRGKLHAHRALWREDAFALGNVGAWSVIAVSDGAGSAPLSRVGSRIACDHALQSLQASLGQLDQLSDDAQTLAADDLPKLRNALIGAATDALAALNQEAQTRSQPLSAFAATLLILVRRAWNDKQLCAAIQIGDGAIALDCQSGLKMLGEADHGQHSSETRFLTTSGIEASLASRVKFSLPDDLRATLVVSDGVSDDYFPEDKRLPELFDAVKPLAQNADDAGKALSEWLGYEKKGSSDDRTLVLSWPGTAIGQVGNTNDDSTNADSAGTDSAGTDSAGTDSAGTDSAGTDSAGTDSGSDEEPALTNGSFDGAGLASSSNRGDDEISETETASNSETNTMQAELPPSVAVDAEPETRLEEGASPAPSELPVMDASSLDETDATEPTDGS